MAYMYSIRTGELIIREGKIWNNEFYLRDEDRSRKMRVWNCKTQTMEEPQDVVFLEHRDDKTAIKLLIEKQTNYIKEETERLERLKARLPYLEERLEQV